MSKTPLGRLDAAAFGILKIPRLEQSVLDGFRALGDLTGTTSDALDECRIAGVTVRPGDLVVADEVGVCFIPFERAAEVLAVAQRLAKREAERLAKLDSGLKLSDWVKL